MSYEPFTPTFLFESELARYGLPTPDVQPDIMGLVQFASSIIDQRCGRLDGDGNGSLVYTTYTQRILLQTRNRNMIQIPLKPIVGLDTATVAYLQQHAASGAYNVCYTGVLPNSVHLANGTLSGFVSASGRYGYTRQDMSIAYPDLFAFINPLNLVTMFGGPAPWIPLDISIMDYDYKTGEVWLPAGLQLQRYSEVIVVYNSGYDPFRLPRAIKQVCAAAVKNLLSKGDGTTGMKSMTVGRSGVNVGMTDNILDPTLEQLLVPFMMIRAY